VRLSSREAAWSSVAPQRSTGNPVSRISCNAALVERSDVRLSSRKAAWNSVAPQRSIGNPASRISCNVAPVERSDVRLSSRKAAWNSVAPQRSIRNPASRISCSAALVERSDVAFLHGKPHGIRWPHKDPQKIRLPEISLQRGASGEKRCAAFSTESRTRRCWRRVAGNPVRSGPKASRGKRMTKFEGGSPPWHWWRWMDRTG
jgi:hypothetical protein